MFNGFFLIFVGINVFIESIERIYEPQYIQSSNLLLVSVLGLLVNVIGLVFFHEHAHSHSHEHDHDHVHDQSHDHAHDSESHSYDACSHHRHDNENLKGVFLHVLADALGSVAVIVSSIAIHFGGYYIADPICCFLISILILASVVPLIKSTYRVLSQSQSGQLAKKVEKHLKGMALPADDLTLKITELHVWELAQQKMVCTLKVTVQQLPSEEPSRPTTTTASLTSQITSLLAPLGIADLTCQVTLELHEPTFTIEVIGSDIVNERVIDVEGSPSGEGEYSEKLQLNKSD